MSLTEPNTPFIGAKSATKIEHPGVYILGFPYDGSTSFRPGARFGPSSIRSSSYGLESYSSYLDKDLEDYDIYDLGNLEMYPSRFEIMSQNFNQIISGSLESICLLTLGGEHSISINPIREYFAQYKDLLIIHLDAHADLRDGYLGDQNSHASIMKRVYDNKSSEQDIFHYGIRSGTREEFQFLKDCPFYFQSLEEFKSALNNIPKDRPVYLTLDLDFFDPAELPGTGTPEAGGASFHDFVAINKILNTKNFVGADIVELSPQYDPSERSQVMASKITREILLTLNR
jgi:agmatinase